MRDASGTEALGAFVGGEGSGRETSWLQAQALWNAAGQLREYIDMRGKKCANPLPAATATQRPVVAGSNELQKAVSSWESCITNSQNSQD